MKPLIPPAHRILRRRPDGLTKADATPRRTPTSATTKKRDVSGVSFRNRPVITPAEIPTVVSTAPTSVTVAATTAINALKICSFGSGVFIRMLPPGCNHSISNLMLS